VAGDCQDPSCNPSSGSCNPTGVINDGDLPDDGDLCTVGECDNGVPSNPLIDCDDLNACTSDGCDLATGCFNDPIPGCTSCSENADCELDGDPCTVPTCDPLGVCFDEEVPIECDAGFECNPTTGICEEWEVLCPCFIEEELVHNRPYDTYDTCTIWPDRSEQGPGIDINRSDGRYMYVRQPPDKQMLCNFNGCALQPQQGGPGFANWCSRDGNCAGYEVCINQVCTPTDPAPLNEDWYCNNTRSAIENHPDGRQQINTEDAPDTAHSAQKKVLAARPHQG